MQQEVESLRVEEYSHSRKSSRYCYGSRSLEIGDDKESTEQQICTGNANAFGASPCGCAANFKRVKQQTSSSISTVVSRDGVVLSTTPSTTTTYQDITACNAVVTTAITPTTKAWPSLWTCMTMEDRARER